MTMVRDTPAVGPDFTQIVQRTVVIYFCVAVIGAAIIQTVFVDHLFVTQPWFEVLTLFLVFLLHGSIFCLPILIIGILLAYWPNPRKPPPHKVTIAVLFLVSGAIIGSFIYAQAHRFPPYAVSTGVASAWTWGLSVAGGLYWTRLRVVSRPYWNNWFNLFAAVFAAAAVGYA
jgi:hypothetical protein